MQLINNGTQVVIHTDVSYPMFHNETRELVDGAEIAIAAGRRGVVVGYYDGVAMEYEVRLDKTDNEDEIYAGVWLLRPEWFTALPLEGFAEGVSVTLTADITTRHIYGYSDAVRYSAGAKAEIAEVRPNHAFAIKFADGHTYVFNPKHAYLFNPTPINPRLVATRELVASVQATINGGVTGEDFGDHHWSDLENELTYFVNWRKLREADQERRKAFAAVMSNINAEQVALRFIGQPKKKFDAIKDIRTFTTMRLKEAKEFVEGVATVVSHDQRRKLERWLELWNKTEGEDHSLDVMTYAEAQRVVNPSSIPF